MLCAVPPCTMYHAQLLSFPTHAIPDRALVGARGTVQLLHVRTARFVTIVTRQRLLGGGAGLEARVRVGSGVSVMSCE